MASPSLPDSFQNSPGHEFLKYTHNYLSEFIRSSDQKAALLLAGSAALLAFLYPLQSHLAGTCARFLVLIALGFILLSALIAAFAVKPRQHEIKTGLIAWEGILSQGGPAAYRTSTLAISEDQFTKEVADHNYALAGILHDKYRFIRCAVWLLIGGGIIGAVGIILSFVLPRLGT